MADGNYFVFTRREWRGWTGTWRYDTSWLFRKSSGRGEDTSPYRGFDPRDEIMLVAVGSPAVVFSIHRSLLSSSSEFFKARVKAVWSNDGAKIDLHDQPVGVFNTYARWLYTRDISLNLAHSDAGKQYDYVCKILAQAYVFGEALMDTAFKHTVLDTILEMLQNDRPGVWSWSAAREVIKPLYSGTPAGSKARKFIVAIFREYADEEPFDEDDDELPKDFLLDVARALASRRSGEPVSLIDYLQSKPCEYHSHPVGEGCYLSEKLI